MEAKKRRAAFQKISGWTSTRTHLALQDISDVLLESAASERPFVAKTYIDGIELSAKNKKKGNNMNKYIHGGICAAIGVTKFAMLRISKGKSFHALGASRISPRTEITVDCGGNLLIGKHLKMRSGAKLRVRKCARVVIGNEFYMSNQCILVSYESITIGYGVELGPGVLIYDHDHDYRAPGGLSAHKFKTSPIVIGNNVWIGGNSVILRGTTIGNNCVVAAGTILHGNYPDNCLIYQEKQTKVKAIERRE